MRYSYFYSGEYAASVLRSFIYRCSVSVWIFAYISGFDRGAWISVSLEKKKDGASSLILVGHCSAICGDVGSKIVHEHRSLVVKSALRNIQLGAAAASIIYCSVATAQTSETTTAEAYLGFEQFSTVVPYDRVDFVDKLKWAGMKFFNAPAAGRVVSLYDYRTGKLAGVECLSGNLKDQYALFVNWLVPKDAIIHTVKGVVGEDAVKVIGNEEWSNAGEWVSAVAVAAWFEDIAKQTKNEELKNLFIEPEPVWHELSFADECDLRDSVTELKGKNIRWYPVLNAKLRSVIGEGTGATSQEIKREPHVIVAKKLAEVEPEKRYWAECFPRSGESAAMKNLCGASVK
ncbi:MAG: hypothetical protein OXE57_09695 [Alphaproteobacteria bacterium]|nr:hypothetical protein [Alphaproteobacteria bacterium]